MFQAKYLRRQSLLHAEASLLPGQSDQLSRALELQQERTQMVEALPPSTSRTGVYIDCLVEEAYTLYR